MRIVYYVQDNAVEGYKNSYQKKTHHLRDGFVS